MMYRLYLETDLNRVFTQSLGSVAAAELDVILRLRHDRVAPEIAMVDEGRSTFLRFDHDGDGADLAGSLAALSATAAVFVEHSPTSLEPVPLEEGLAFGTDVVTAQRYKGKTSERLTRLMLNLAMAADRSTPNQGWSVVDPMCGRGTTLNWALLYGGRAVGLDLDRRALDEYATFLEQWAKHNRLPHKMVRHRKGSSASHHFDFTVAADRDGLAAKSGPDIRTFHAPADSDGLPLGRHSMIVSDLPYDVQHRARSGGDRAPAPVDELVASVAARFDTWLLDGGSVALSWNAKRLPRAELIALLGRAGFVDLASTGFEHKVDRMITRDVLLAARADVG